MPVRMALHTDRGGAAAAADVGEPSTSGEDDGGGEDGDEGGPSYPEVPLRVLPACDVFGEAAYFEAALWLKSRKSWSQPVAGSDGPAGTCMGSGLQPRHLYFMYALLA